MKSGKVNTVGGGASDSKGQKSIFDFFRNAQANNEKPAEVEREKARSPDE
eukprot:CAMPEP_0118942778 /NCGR_PEP_ID=MMETSP1169-20130426/36815_1 /TAXON_ID=36882 /ORGANISM="Pyramimonas obovata, Strain CCMP722" /LENGTH=49 /DNA_ID= /DNA_START= /DNA_END= /DNA_ORIENTATION=